MKIFIVALPLFDYSMSVDAYRLCQHSGDKMMGIKDNFMRMSEALYSPGLELVESVGLGSFTGNNTLFADISKLQILTGSLKNLYIDPTKLVCVLPAEDAEDQDMVVKCAELKEAGYRFALDAYPKKGKDSAILSVLDYIYLDYSNAHFYPWLKSVNKDMRKIRPVVLNIPDTDTFDMLSNDHKCLFTGDFYSQPITKGVSVISPVKINALHLINQVNQEEFDLLDAVKIIERDPYLTISLLRFINSGAIGISRKIESIKGAVAILGQKEVRKWATVAISMSLAEDRPSEITKLSLVRAKFAENLAGAFELGVFQPQLFMTGLFSMLDVILQKPMEEAIQEVSIDNRVREALVNKSGELYKVLDLIYAYEHADWDKASIVMIQNNTDIETVSNAFIDALQWYNQLLQAIDDQ